MMTRLWGLGYQGILEANKIDQLVSTLSVKTEKWVRVQNRENTHKKEPNRRKANQIVMLNCLAFLFVKSSVPLSTEITRPYLGIGLYLRPMVSPRYTCEDEFGTSVRGNRLFENRAGLRTKGAFAHMRYKQFAIVVGAVTLFIGLTLLAQQDKYSLKVPGGLAFSEFRGYEGWQVIAVSHNGDKLAATLGNPEMINAYMAGIPGNGKPFPDGAKMAKVHWNAIKSTSSPGEPTVPGTLHDVDFMAKDTKRFVDSGGWGYAAFEYDTASNSYRPGNSTDRPPQENDAKCGYSCHTVVQKRDYVFTDYGPR